MKYYILGFPVYSRTVEMDSLEEVIQWINERVLGRMDYSIFTGYPCTFNNLVYQHFAKEDKNESI